MTPVEPDETWAEPEEVAELAGLHHVNDGEPGYGRRRRGRGWSYHDASGAAVLDPDELARIRSLAVPPAWRDVWICADARGHLQATGRDERGRKQYRYHPRWRELRDAAKFDQLVAFGHALPGIRRHVEEQLRGTRASRDRVLALVLELLDDTLVRVGNEEYERQNRTYGLTTLRRRHVRLDEREAALTFVGKGGRRHRVEVGDRRLVRLTRRCHELDGRRLFSYLGEGGEVVAVTSTDVNEHLRALTGEPFTAKTFRTWGATAVAAEHLLSLGPPTGVSAARHDALAAIDAAAEALGNTRAVCRRSYVHPVLEQLHTSGSLHELHARARAHRELRRVEAALLRALEGDELARRAGAGAA